MSAAKKWNNLLKAFLILTFFNNSKYVNLNLNDFKPSECVKTYLIWTLGIWIQIFKCAHHIFNEFDWRHSPTHPPSLLLPPVRLGLAWLGRLVPHDCSYEAPTTMAVAALVDAFFWLSENWSPSGEIRLKRANIGFLFDDYYPYL